MSHAVSSIDRKRDGGDYIPALGEHPCLEALRIQTEDARASIEHMCRGGGKEQRLIAAVTDAIHGLSLGQFERFGDLIRHFRAQKIFTVEQGLHWLIKNDPSMMPFASDIGVLHCKWASRHQEINADIKFMNELTMIARSVYPSGANTILKTGKLDYVPSGSRIMINIAGYPVEVSPVPEGVEILYPVHSSHEALDDTEKTMLYSRILRINEAALVGRSQILKCVFDESLDEPLRLDPECNVENIIDISRAGLLVLLCEEGVYCFDRISTNVARIRETEEVERVLSPDDTHMCSSDKSGIRKHR